MTDIEQSMKEALDGKFYSFVHNDAGGMKIHEKPVPKHYFPKYEAPRPDESGKRGGWASVKLKQLRMKTFWTPAKVAELKRLQATGDSARKIGRVLGISRWMVGQKLNELNILNRYGDIYK